MRRHPADMLTLQPGEAFQLGIDFADPLPLQLSGMSAWAQPSIANLKKLPDLTEAQPNPPARL